MKVAIIGLELAGKTTLFQALTRGQAAAGRPGESQVAVVEVPDRRMDVLVEMYRPRKVARAAVEFVDGVGAAGGPRFGAAFLADVRASDALVHLTRAFENPAVPVTRPPDPLRDARELDAELILADLDLVEKRLERQRASQKGRPKGTAAEGAIELDVLARLKDHLEAELPARAFRRSDQETEATRHLAFLSDKPVALVANINESEIGAPSGALDALQEYAERAGYPLLDICAKVEAEVAQLPPEEETAFLEAMGVPESGRYRLIRTVYDLLGLHCFFTVGEDEVKAWTIRRGDNAVTAAARLHPRRGHSLRRARRRRQSEGGAGRGPLPPGAEAVRREGRRYSEYPLLGLALDTLPE
jgi:ribosome-binding ATPase YchF (GTP1/OBG family)